MEHGVEAFRTVVEVIACAQSRAVENFWSEWHGTPEYDAALSRFLGAHDEHARTSYAAAVEHAWVVPA